MNKTNEVVHFFEKVQKAVSKYGVEKVLEQLRELQYSVGKDKKSVVCRFIVSSTANHYLISSEDIIHSKKRGVISESRRMCFALMKEHLKMSDEEIGDYFDGRSRQYVNKELTSLTINEDTLSSKHEKKFYEDFIKLSIMVLRYRNSYQSTKASNE